VRAELLVHDLSVLYTLDAAAGEDLGRHERWSVGFAEGALVYLGPAAHAPDADEVLDGEGLVGLPGLVDPHTHAVWAGSRAAEFRRRLAGVPYAQILEEGGGILHTVAATRAATRAALTEAARARIRRLVRRGVTTVEVKSGYGLDPATEERLLRCAWDLQDTARIVPTFLGAHTVPAEHRARRAAYVRELVEVQIPRCAPLADFIDVYCDRGAFSLDEAVEILRAGRAAGLRLKAHAEQVTHTGIAAAAAALGATSCEHLEHVDDAGIAALAAAGTVAVLLPGAQLYLRDRPPPVAALREAGVPIALGTDLNPGSSPLHDPLAAATLACVLQGLTVEEAIRGLTVNAAAALARPALGRLRVGGAADLAVFAPPAGEPPGIDALVQHLGGSDAVIVIRDGARAH
jgi:imidazolonepropionase